MRRFESWRANTYAFTPTRITNRTWKGKKDKGNGDKNTTVMKRKKDG